MTKPVVSMAVMKLVEEGAVRLEDNVSKHVPEWDDDKVVLKEDGVTTEPASRPITILDLLTHTSGLDYGFWPVAVSKTASQYRQAGLEIPTPITHYAGDAEPLPLPASLTEFCTRLNKVQLSAQPGERFQYGVSTDVLGRVIESVTGDSLGTHLKKTLFEPLGMSDTSFMLPKEKTSRLAKCYTAKGKGSYALAEAGGIGYTDERNPWVDRKWMEECPSAGGGLISTPDDYTKFAQMMLTGSYNGVTFLKTETLEMMRTDQLAPRGAKKTSIAAAFDGFGLGLGLALSPSSPTSYPGAGLAGHGTGGWGGAAATTYFTDPVNDLTIVLFAQLLNYPESIPMLRFEVLKAFYEGLLGRKSGETADVAGGFTG
eukprot:TRINITY_DN10722_c0_g1_i3.p1 TRINITY_DN10722_c0_g1~~TRINITY_DN10722_c0_g1_i3.p1  ORF type:complete len:380 (+),score=47.01 TRINITY_DN10722_c0_g1_i3:30-1142(+)